MKIPAIREPFWKDNALGIADKYFSKAEYLEVECLYKTKTGSRLYPNPFRIQTSHRNFYKTMTRGKTLLRIVPFVSMQELTGEKNEQTENTD